LELLKRHYSSFPKGAKSYRYSALATGGKKLVEAMWQSLLISSVCSNSLLGFLGDEKSSVSDLVHGAPSVPYHGPAITDDKVGQDAGLDDTMLTSVGVSLTEYNFKTGSSMPVTFFNYSKS
jgi:hypothetical protein